MGFCLVNRFDRSLCDTHARCQFVSSSRSDRLAPRIELLERLKRLKRLEPLFFARGMPTTVAARAGDRAAGSSE
jgi:hypothetical protein